jgi:GDPmannose 4,6-dehydratase
LHYDDLAHIEQLTHLIYNTKPDEIYHLGAQSHVKVSFDMPEYTGNITGLGTTRILEAVRCSGIKTKYYQASSSEMFGSAPPPQNENTAFRPRSPYAAAKVYAYWMAVNYREGYNLFACNGVLFNHESPRRGETFVTRKITRGIARILAGQEQTIYLGNLEGRRDWGYAPEYVEAMWLMLQQEEADDYVVGTGGSYSVRDFAEAAFAYIGLDWTAHVKVDPRYFRPTEVDCLRADISKASRKLGWEPKVTFNDLIAIMVDADMQAIGLEPVGKGSRVLAEKFPNWQHRPAAVTSALRKNQQQFE